MNSCATLFMSDVMRLNKKKKKKEKTHRVKPLHLTEGG